MRVTQMREPTRDEAETLRLREERFDAFLAERIAVLAEFAASSGLAESVLIVADPAAVLPAIQRFMGHQVVDPFEVAQAYPRAERELRSAFARPGVSRRLGSQRRGSSGAAFHVVNGSKTSVVP